MDLTFSINRDAELFCRLNDRARRTVKRRLRAMRKISDGKSIADGCRAVLAEFSGERGYSVKRLYQLYLAYTKTGDWKVLVNKALAGPNWYVGGGAGTLPDAFVDFISSEWALSQRGKFKAVHVRLVERLRRWQRGDSSARIPGYDAPPQAIGVDGLPAGWSYDNLLIAAKNRASRFSRKLIQIGPKSAHLAEAPHVLSTRAGLEVGEYFIVDDSWNDFKVVAFGQTVRLLSFHILELASGCNVKRGYKPAITDERNIEQRLREREMIWLGVAHLTQTGYRPAGTTFIAEKATATFPDWFEETLFNFDIPIKVQRGPRGGGPGIDALFTGPGGGNPRWKAPLESWFNLLRNRTDHLLEFPGQTGSYSSGLPMPEGLAGLERDTKALLAAARTLPPQRAELLRLGMLNFSDAIFALEKITDVINFRTDHDLEGWRKCGHIVTEWRANETLPWHPAADLLQLQNGESEIVASLLAANPKLKRERNLSPAEVFYSRMDSLQKIPLHVAAELMSHIPLTPEETGCVVKRGVIEVQCREVDADEPLRYGLTRRNGSGVEEPLRADDKFDVRVNGCDPSQAFLYHANGSFAGVAKNYGRDTRDEIQNGHRQFIQKRQWLASQTEDARFMASRVTRADIERNVENSRVIQNQKSETQISDDETDAALQRAVQ